MSEAPEREPSTDDDDEPGRVLSVHVGHSANCSSVGSFVDFLFVSSVLGAAALGAYAILVRKQGETAKADEPAGSVDDPSAIRRDEEE
ncbi:MAG: hypothetical protein AB7S26_00930 [Sandaracinaceae bacterium]